MERVARANVPAARQRDAGWRQHIGLGKRRRHDDSDRGSWLGGDRAGCGDRARDRTDRRASGTPGQEADAMNVVTDSMHGPGGDSMTTRLAGVVLRAELVVVACTFFVFAFLHLG